MKKYLYLNIAVLILGFSLPAQAQIKIVLGGDSLERTCYEKALYGNTGTKRAIDICNDAVENFTTHKNRPANHINRGVLLMRSGKLEAARRDYEKAIELNPDLRDAYVNYGALLIQMQDYDAALTALNKAVEGEHTKHLHEALYNRAIAYDRQDRFREAYLDLKRALELRPEWDDAKRAISRYSVAKKSG